MPSNSPVALNYDLRGYLQRTQQREWNSPADTVAILEEILSLLSEDGKGEKACPPQESTESADSTEELVTSTPKADSLDRPPLPVAEPELPGGQVDLASAFYVKRHPIEERCFEAIAKLRSFLLHIGDRKSLAVCANRAAQKRAIAYYLDVKTSFDSLAEVAEH